MCTFRHDIYLVINKLTQKWKYIYNLIFASHMMYVYEQVK